MNDRATKGKIVFYSVLLFLLMTIHIVGIIEASEAQVNNQTSAISAFNG